ncbi:MAG: hypothetical protein VW124_26055, partial [Paracoccaceae bacterium]
MIAFACACDATLSASAISVFCQRDTLFLRYNEQHHLTGPRLKSLETKVKDKKHGIDSAYTKSVEQNLGRTSVLTLW